MEPPRHSDWILKLFTARAGAEIERRQVERVQRRYAERLKTLQEIDRAILAAQSPAEIAAPALKHVQALVPCFRTSVALFDPETGEGVLHTVEAKSEGLGQGARVAPESFGSLDELRAGERSHRRRCTQPPPESCGRPPRASWAPFLGQRAARGPRRVVRHAERGMGPAGRTFGGRDQHPAGSGPQPSGRHSTGTPVQGAQRAPGGDVPGPRHPLDARSTR